ncbi:MAG: hypothetical protein ACREGR_01610 [Minisyncoccia bacterium]
MLEEVARVALADMASAYKVLAGDVPDGELPEVPGKSADEVRKVLALELVGRAGAVLSKAVEVASEANMMMALLAGPAMLTGPAPVEDKEPFGFAAVVKRMQAAKAA